MEEASMMEELQMRRVQRIEELTDSEDLSKDLKDVTHEENLNASVDNENEPVEIPSSPQNNDLMNMSIKDKLRSRIKNASDKTSNVPRKLKGLRDRALPNRFEEVGTVNNLSTELDPMLQQSLASTKQWKKLKLRKDKEAGIISEEEAFQFFVGAIDGEDKPGQSELSPSSDEVRSSEMRDSHFFTQQVKPVFPTNREQLLMESKNYFHPSSIPALPEEKMVDSVPLRNLEDEGFYVGKTPPVKLANLSEMENRIIAENKNHRHEWFDVDGHLKRLADPLQEHSVRQMITDDFDINPEFELDWLKADLFSLDTKYIDKEGKLYYQLDVDISSIKFLHHQLFSQEHLFESKLIQMTQQYTQCQTNSQGEHLRNKIDTLYSSLNELPRNKAKMKDKKTKEKTDYQCGVYNEIKELQMNIENEEMKERSLVVSILSLWKSLKKLRESQTFTNTTSVLKVRKVLTNRVADQQNIEKELSQRTETERFFFKLRHEAELTEYQKKLLKWKKYQKQKASVADGDDHDGVRQEDEILAVPKPPPPPAFNEEETRIKIREQMMKYKRKPGEPILIPELQSGAVITPTEKCPRAEQLRRADMKSSRYFIKVLFNDLEVSRSDIRGLSNDFLVHFGEILNIQILQWPESIKLQIFDSVSKKMIASLYAAIPGNTVTSNTIQEPLAGLEFSCDQIIRFTRHNAVGCGVPVILDDGDTTIPLIYGSLYASVSWGVDEDGNSLGPSNFITPKRTSKHFDFLSDLGAEGVFDLQRLLSSISSAKLDPNDPSNANIISLAKMAQLSHFNNMVNGPLFFRLKHLEENMDILSKEEMDLNKRLKLIKLRSSGDLEFKHFQNIPISEKLISDDFFEKHRKAQYNTIPADVNVKDGIDQRESIAIFLSKVRQQVHSRSELAKKQLDLQDIVTEEEIPDLGSLGARIGQIMEPKRPLKPTRKERKKIGGQGLASVKEVKVLVNIIRAFNLPVRSFKVSKTRQPREQFLDGSTRNESQGVQTLLQPFIEVMFQGNVLATSTADGCFPNWNEDMILPFKAPNNDYTTDALQLIKDNVYISLFDHVLIDMNEDNRLQRSTIHQHIQRRYLGRIEIPFSTIYFNSKVEGFIPLKSPSVLLGYHPCSIELNGVNMIKEVPMLQLFLTIDPNLQPAPSMPEIFNTNETDALVRYSLQWLTELRSKFRNSNRVFKVLVSDLDGKKVFISRYLHRQKPPDELLLDNAVVEMKKMKLLARFVSLIPYIPDSVQFPDLCDIWTTSDQFLRMLAGDEEEHAVLLCNYFLWMNKRAYLVLGYGIPEGSTAYVLTDEGTSFRIWNASSGKSYEIENVHCPLQIVGCVITEDNIYANIQQDTHPSKLSFNFANPKLWKPFFNKKFPNPGISSIQVEEPTYMPIDSQFAVNLQDELDHYLRERLMAWRPTSITKFHRGCTQAFKILLESIENKIVLSEINPAEHQNQLDQFAASHHITGYTLQMAFTDVDAVAKSVKSTGIHKIEDARTEFAIASHVHPYPSGVLAVWVYIGSLVRKNL